MANNLKKRLEDENVYPKPNLSLSNGKGGLTSPNNDPNYGKVNNTFEKGTYKDTMLNIPKIWRG
jgi:hypothetical protein